MLLFGFVGGLVVMGLIWVISGVFHTEGKSNQTPEEQLVNAIGALGIREISVGRLRRGEFVVGPYSTAKNYTLLKVAPSLLWNNKSAMAFLFNHEGELDSCGCEPDQVG
jgi:hypothetical protein